MTNLLVSGIHPAELKVKVKTRSAGGARAAGVPGPLECCDGGGGRTRGRGAQGKESSDAGGYGEIREANLPQVSPSQIQCGQGPAQHVPWPWAFRRSYGFPDGAEGKASACNAGDPGLILGWGDPLEKEMATHPTTLAWKIPWRGSLVGYSPWGRRVGLN